MDESPTQSTVLVAEDNMNVRKILCVFLEKQGYKTLEAGNGREAIEIVNLQKPDVILLDVMMPITDGFTVCRTLKDDPETRGIPIIMCTAKSNKQDLITAIRSGAEDYIIKPFRRDLVLRKVERALRRGTKSSATLVSVNRREVPRKSAKWKVSWGKEAERSGLPSMYKARVTNISPKGFAFEFNRCEVCTGYEQSTIHPLCLFAGKATRFAESQEITFVLNVKRDLVIEARGKIVHVHQKEELPGSEKVGVAFVEVDEEARRTIEDFVEDRLAV